MKPGVDCSYDLRNGAIVLVPFASSLCEAPPLLRCCTCKRDLPHYWFPHERSEPLGRHAMSDRGWRGLRCVPCKHGWDPAWNVDEVLRLKDRGLVKWRER